MATHHVELDIRVHKTIWWHLTIALGKLGLLNLVKYVPSGKPLIHIRTSKRYQGTVTSSTNTVTAKHLLDRINA